MAVAFRAASSGFAGAQTGGVQILDIDIPSTVQAGDVLLMVVGVNDTKANYTLSTPTGWAVLRDVTAGSQYTVLLYKVAGAGDAGSSVQFQVTAVSGGTGAKVQGVLVAYSGASLDQHQALGASGSSESHATPVVTPSSYPAVGVIAIGKKSSSLTSITVPSGYTERRSALSTGGGAMGVVVADRAVSSGSVGGESFTAPGAASAAATTFTITLTEQATSPGNGLEIVVRRNGQWVAGEILMRSGGQWVPAEISLRRNGTWE